MACYRLRHQLHSACNHIMSITQLDINITSGHFVNPVVIDMTDVIAANRVSIFISIQARRQMG